MQKWTIAAMCLVCPSWAFRIFGIVDPMNDRPNRFRDEINSRKHGGEDIGTSQLDRIGGPQSAKLKMDRPAENRYDQGRGLQGSCSWISSGRCTNLDGTRTFKEAWARDRPERREWYRENAWEVIPSTKVHFIRHHGLRVNPDIIDERYSDDVRFNHRYGRRH